MKNDKGLRAILRKFIPLNKARLDCFSDLLQATLILRIVNLNILATAIPSQTKLESRIRRLQRFFAQVTIDYKSLAKVLFHLIFSEGQKVELIMDRTNWKFGLVDINILMLSAVHNGVSIPLFWKLLGHAGNSKVQERAELLNQFIETFGRGAIKYLLADREFIGAEWLDYLTHQRIAYLLRTKDNIEAFDPRKKKYVASKALFKNLAKGKARKRARYYIFLGHRVHLYGSRDSKGELQVLISPLQLKKAAKKYKKRWQIETLFQSLKGRGFHLEETHLIRPERLKLLIAVLGIAFVWALRVGLCLNESNPVRVKKHGRLSQSLFRLGLDRLSEAVIRRSYQYHEMNVLELFRLNTSTFCWSR